MGWEKLERGEEVVVIVRDRKVDGCRSELYIANVVDTE